MVKLSKEDIVNKLDEVKGFIDEVLEYEAYKTMTATEVVAIIVASMITAETARRVMEKRTIENNVLDFFNRKKKETKEE